LVDYDYISSIIDDVYCKWKEYYPPYNYSRLFEACSIILHKTPEEIGNNGDRRIYILEDLFYDEYYVKYVIAEWVCENMMPKASLFIKRKIIKGVLK
jgi:hypothetical protein